MWWTLLVRFFSEMAKDWIQSYEIRQEAEQAGAAKAKLRDEQDSDATILRATYARDAVTRADANAASLHAAEQTDPDCRDNQQVLPGLEDHVILAKGH